MHEDPYLVLNVSPFATPEQIQRAYRRLAKIYHPDINEQPDADARMQQINWAYELLRDPASRAKYDQANPVRPRPQPTRTSVKPPYWRESPAAATRPEWSPNLNRNARVRSAKARPSVKATHATSFERMSLGLLAGIGALLLFAPLGSYAECLGIPLALGIGCWIASVPNSSESALNGVMTGIATSLFGSILLLNSALPPSEGELGFGAYLIFGALCMLFGVPGGAAMGSIAGWLKRNLRT